MKQEGNNPRRDYIILKAAEIMRNQGYAGATMRDIAREVGMEVSSLYNHIRSKHDILATICFSIGDEYITGLDTILDRETAYPEKLSCIIGLHIDLAARHKDLMIVFEEEWKHLQDEDLKKFKSMRAYYEKKLENFFRLGMEQGKFKNMDDRTMLLTFLSSIKWLNYFFKDKNNYDIAVLKREVMALISHGLLADPH